MIGLMNRDLPTELSELSISVLSYPRRIPSLKAFVVELQQERAAVSSQLSKICTYKIPKGSYLISRNERDELALVSRTVMATWVVEAFDIFFSGLTPFLDHLSFLSNTPIDGGRHG